MSTQLQRRLTRLGAVLIAALAAHALALAAASAQAPRKVAVVSFGLFGGQGVFRSEATAAAQIVASRFGGDPVIVRFNTRKTAEATIETLAATLSSTAKRIDADADILFLILTTHGSPQGLAVTGGRKASTLSPSRLTAIVNQTGVRHRVVIISACYSGIFIPGLATPDTLVITAADAHHPSFGCEDKAKWTYFGDAFFNSALRQSPTLKEAFARAHTLVSSWELRSGFEPSNPQMAGGENVEPLLVAKQ
jgi:hypothetical protein